MGRRPADYQPPTRLLIEFSEDGDLPEDVERRLGLADSEVSWSAWEEAFERVDATKQPQLIHFAPNAGPQTMCYESEADIIGFGGQAGGGKTGVAVGLALTKHKKTLILRREATQLREVVDITTKYVGSRDGFNENKGIWRGLPGGKQIEFGGVGEEGDQDKWQGRAHDLKVFDEAAQFPEHMYRFINTWTRTDEFVTLPDGSKVKQKCTTLLCFNPPTDESGYWIIDYFGPWLDENHENPAKDGELRWYVRINDADVAVEDGRPLLARDGKPFYDFDLAAYESDLSLRDLVLYPKSRTFIRSSVRDNPHLGQEYVRTLQDLPEPLRSQMLEGKFTKHTDENPWQLIPSEWCREAQKRWRDAGGTLPDDAKLVSLGLDVARGGKDNTITSPWYEGTRTINGKVWKVFHLARQIGFPGATTTNGEITKNLVIPYWQPGALINVDSIGYGASAYDELQKELNKPGAPVVVHGIDNGAGPEPRGKDTSGKVVPDTDRSGIYQFGNRRAQTGWRLRELMDPSSDVLIELPDDPELREDLCTPNWEPRGGKIFIELKEAIKKRLPHRRSPDKGDSAILGLANRGTGAVPRRMATVRVKKW